MRRDPRAYLADIIEAAGLVIQFTKGLDLEAYRADRMVRSATERQLEIVGEALTQLRRVAPDISARIPDHRRIIGFRNVLIHGYDVVDDEDRLESGYGRGARTGRGCDRTAFRAGRRDHDVAVLPGPIAGDDPVRRTDPVPN